MDRANSIVKRKDMGLAGAIIVLSQVVSSFQSSRNLSLEIQELKFEVRELKTNQENLFVTHADLRRMEAKIDAEINKIKRRG